MAVAAVGLGTTVFALAQRIILIREEKRIGTLVKVDNRVNELVENPAFREEMRQKAQQRLEDERDRAFCAMDRNACLYATSMWGGGPKSLRKWREQASFELRQLRETERLRQWTKNPLSLPGSS
ncbi:hypothetical protein BDR22DRAFT_590826 [Usnea florida]